MNTLFQISTLENWPSYLYKIVDAVGPEKSTQVNYNQYAALYIVIFICITTFFIVNLYVGTIVKKFSEIHDELDGSLLLTRKQREWVQTQKLLLKVSPKIRYIRPTNKFRGRLFDFVLNYKFDYLVLSCIAMNVVFMCLYHRSMDLELKILLDASNVFFTLIFSIECMIKIIGLGPKYYFASAWNIFDFVITAVSIISFSQSI